METGCPTCAPFRIVHGRIYFVRTTKNTHIVGGSPILVNAALDAIRMWRYEPGAKETVEVVEIDFKNPN